MDYECGKIYLGLTQESLVKDILFAYCAKRHSHKKQIQFIPGNDAIRLDHNGAAVR